MIGFRKVAPFLCAVLVLSGSGASAESLVKNGGMEAGDSFPAEWKNVEADEGVLLAVRDTSEKAEGEASLRIESKDGPASGKVSQILSLLPGETLKISGKGRVSENVSRASIALVTPQAAESWNEVVRFDGLHEWGDFSATWQVPEKGEFAVLLVFFQGEGVLHLDDLSITRVDSKPVDKLEGTLQLSDFSEPALFSYLSFEKKYSIENGKGVLRSNDGKGGLGFALGLNLKNVSDHSPRLTVVSEQEHKAGKVLLVFEDRKKETLTFTYDLAKLTPGVEASLLPEGARSLQQPGFDLAEVANLQVKGDWQGDRVALRFHDLTLVPPTEEMLAQREELKAREAEERERKRKREEWNRLQKEKRLSEGSSHPEDGPDVRHVGMAGPDLIGLELIAGEVHPTAPVPYMPREGDVKKPDKHKVLAWKNGRPAIVAKGTLIERKVDGRNQKLGHWNEEAGTVWNEKKTGQDLNLEAVDEPRAYRVSINGAEAIHPVEVFRKSKPTRVGMGSGEFGAQHFVYLKLPQVVAEGSQVEVQLFALNTRQEKVAFEFDSKTVRTESLHVSHLGYRPDDPLKRAYLSLWTGTGGGYEFSTGSFSLLSETGDSVYEGEIVLGVSRDTVEPFNNPRNHSGTDVYHLDFSDFSEPGEYRIHVPGLGVSDSFVIGEDQWKKAFEVSMFGFLTHRSGIDLGPPLTAYRRPRPMHPADGVKVFEAGVVLWDGEASAIDSDLRLQLGDDLDPSRLREFENGWGGYMDAGDWDRRSQHLMASYRHLELFELFPDAMAAIPLRLSEEEVANDIPDVVEEALWNLEFYLRLQNEDGGVRGGIESTAHPRDAETSWQETLLLGVFAPDPETSYRFAAVAAKAARLLSENDRAAEWRDSAEKAWKWAGEEGDVVLAAVEKRNPKVVGKAAENTRKMRTLAAAELFHLTGEESYLSVVQSADRKTLQDPDIGMSVALLPESVGEVRSSAIESILSAADEVVKMSESNGFNLAPGTRYLPMMGYTSIWSTPGAAMPPIVPRAHYLSGEEKYLATTIASTQYPGGANPMNMSYTTGIGHRFPQAPLHIDSRASGQKAPAGITVYGQSDPSSGYAFDSFAHTWFLNRFGGVPSKEWPTAEAYIDLGNWPAMNEYTIHQNLAPTSYVWGYLAGRAPLSESGDE